MRIAYLKLVGAAALLVGLFGLHWTSTEAADPVPESEFKVLVEQDARNIQAVLDSLNDVKPEAKKAADKRSARAIKSNAMSIALLANSRISGKNAADDAKWAALRDSAIKAAVDGGKKDFNAVGRIVPMLTVNAAPAKGAAKPMKITDLVKAAGLDLDELMHQYKTIETGGLGIEKEIRAYGNPDNDAMPTPAKAAQIATRVLAVSEYAQIVTIPEWTVKKTEKDWKRFNKNLETAAQEVLAASKGNDAKKLKAAFEKLDGSCTACHGVMK